MAGLDSNGLTIATVEEIVTDINTAMLSTVSSTLKLGGTTLLGQIIGIFAERLAVLWELAEAVYSSQDPDAATGEALVQVAALTGTIPLPASESTVTLTLTGTPATLVDAGSVAGTAAGVQFETLEDATIASATAWASATAYALGTVRRNASRIYLVTVAGTSAGSGGPTTDDDAIVDGTVTWRYLGEGTGYIDVEAQATETGALAAVSGSVVEIVTPVSGWSSVINVLDAEVGREEESDEELRVRREEDLSNAGTSPVDAIRSALLQVDGVTAVTVFHNPTDGTVDGMPPHSVEALVQGGEDQDIWDALLASVAAGIRCFGDEDGTATDAVGNVHDVAFTRPDEIEIYVDLDVEYDARSYPLDGDDQVIAAIVAYGDSLAAGVNVRSSAVSAPAFSVTGVLGTLNVFIGTAPSPGASTTIAIGLRERAVFDTSRVSVTSSAVTP
jgi:uncharacterized phage protein gp47/JayE